MTGTDADDLLVKIHIQPTVIMLSTRIDDEVDAMMQPEDPAGDGRNDRSTEQCLMGNL